MTRQALARFAAVAALSLAAACAGVRKAPAPGPAAGAALAPGWTSRTFPVREHGVVQLPIPPGWTASAGEEGEASVPSIRLEAAGARFVAILTPLWNPGEPETPQGRADTAQLFAELGRRKALAGSAEGEIPLEDLGPGEVRGWYFSATDRDLVAREPGPDEFRHVLQGAAAVGPVILAFTLLDDGPGAWRSQVLDVVRGARHLADGAGEKGAAGAFELLPDATTLPLRVAAPGRPWAVLVDLPGFQVGHVRSPRLPPDVVHFVARSPQTEIVASVILAPAGGASDARACRDALLTRVAGTADLRLTDEAPGARAWFSRTEEGIRWEHGHVFLFRDGLCADVHVSKAAPEGADATRLEAILSSVRIGEDL